MKIGSLRIKINAAILLTSILIALIFAVIILPFETRRHDSYEKKVYLLLDTLFKQKRDDLANELFARQRRALAASLDEMLKVEGVVAVVVYLPDGEVYLSTDDDFSIPIPESDVGSLVAASSFLTDRDDVGNASLGVYSVGIGVIGMPIGYLRIYYDLGELQRETRYAAVLLVVLLVTILTVMSVILNVLLSHFVTKPVSVLREAIRRLKEGHFGETVHLTSADEIGDVGRAFNEMSVDLMKSRFALQQAEEKYRGIFENAAEGIFQRTPGNGRYLTVNPSMAAMLGYDSPEELLGSMSSAANQLYVDPKDFEEVERVLERRGHIVNFETRLYRRDGSVIRVSASIRSVRDEIGIVQYYEGSFVDVTERRQRENAEREREAAEAASRAKSEFLANMSHEIRTPMNAILGFTSLLEPLISDPRQKSYVRSILSGGKSLMSLINDILDLSKIEAGKMEIQCEPVSLRAIFEELERIFTPTVRKKGLDFKMDIPEGVPDCLMLDEIRLRQVLFNIVGNAVKFTESGWVKLSAARLNEDGDRGIDLVISVEDTGIGIRPGAEKEIFESFTQQSGQDARLYGGTGLGLAISKNLIEMMGGAIYVRSRFGVGSIFEIHLPDLSESSSCSSGEPLEAKEFKGALPGGGKVLIVDDIEVNRRLLIEFMQDTGVEIIEAGNGLAAIHAAGRHLPDLILMDIKMPGMDGFETMSRLREDSVTRGIPIIALTASGMLKDIERIKQSGFNGWLLRPFERFTLLEILSRFVASQGMETGESRDAGDPEPITGPREEGVQREILRLLEGEFMRRWEVVGRKRSIGDIEDFGRRIKALGDRFRARVVSAYAEKLLFHVSGFDIDGIRKVLDAFPELVADIGKQDSGWERRHDRE